MSLKQAIIPAAGLGTRFLPVTKAIPKELIPLGTKTCLEHIVDEAVEAGVEELIFVIAPEKKQIEHYFQPDSRLNTLLKERGHEDFLNQLQKLESKARYRFVYQEEPLGLGHAVNCARKFIDSDYFLVILPDDIIIGDTSVCEQLTQVFEKYKKPLVSVMQVQWEEVNRYGIVRAAALSDSVGEIQDIIEKPKREDSPSNLAVVGRYILPKSIFDLLDKLKPGAGGEIQLTDALRRLIQKEGLLSYAFQGRRFDTGEPLGWLRANIAFAVNQPEFREPLLATMKSLVARYL